jgi:hypothetical protein
MGRRSRHHEAPGVGHTEQAPQLFPKITLAGLKFCSKRQISRRDTLDRICQIEIVQLQSVIARLGFRLIGKPSLVQQRIHEIPGSVASKRAPCAVGSMGTGRQPDQADTGLRIAKPGDGTIPVFTA